MPLVGAPTFAPGILTADQLNSLVTLLEEKFDGGIGTDDLGWPFTAGGNIDMAQFELLHLYKLWNVYNLAERDSSTTLQDVFDAVAGAGGGVVLLPANETETIGTGGVEVGPNTLIIGQGRTSIFATSGVLTNHMFRNVAAGNSGIKFVNCKLTNEGASGGTFDIIGFSRVEACQLIDVWMVVARENGVSFETNSAGSTNTNNAIIRGQFDVDGGAAVVSATDVKGLKIRGAKINLQSGSSISAVVYSALGAASFGEGIHIEGNEVLVDDSVTGGTVFGFTGGATNGIPKCAVSGNEVEVGDSQIDYIIDFNSALGALHAAHNEINGDVQLAAIRVQNSAAGTIIDDNDIYTAGGTGIGILIGGTARSGSVAACKNFICSNNRVSAKSSAFVFVHPGSGNHFSSSIISGNTGISGTAGEAEFEIWNLGSATTTTYTGHLSISNNIADASTSAYGWKNYSDMGSTQGGSFGIASNSYLNFVGNVVQGTDLADSGGDFANTTTGGSGPHYSQTGNVV